MSELLVLPRRDLHLVLAERPFPDGRLSSKFEKSSRDIDLSTNI